MVGGVSLIYKIKPPEDSGTGINVGASNLAEQTMEALKKRVDPDGVRNLVWRPIGAMNWKSRCRWRRTRKNAPVKREAYTEAQAQLQATNIRQSDVLAAIALPAGPKRDKALNELSQGDPAAGRCSSRWRTCRINWPRRGRWRPVRP
jgi:SecD/SecF fusion protein